MVLIAGDGDDEFLLALFGSLDRDENLEPILVSTHSTSDGARPTEYSVTKLDSPPKDRTQTRLVKFD